jgi:uncharacterized protein YjbJ (UPF0337 family)
MTILAFKGNWNIAKGKFKQKFAQLCDDHLQFSAGKKDELVGRIQKRASQEQNRSSVRGNAPSFNINHLKN